MEILIVSLVILGTVLYTLTTMFTYSTESSRLSQELGDTQQRLTQLRRRLTDKLGTAESLEDALPAYRSQRQELKGWITRLQEQHTRLNTEKKSVRRAHLRQTQE